MPGDNLYVSVKVADENTEVSFRRSFTIFALISLVF